MMDAQKRAKTKAKPQFQTCSISDLHGSRFTSKQIIVNICFMDILSFEIDCIDIYVIYSD